MTYVRFNVSRMFAHIEPWDVSNSVANLGPRAAELTWSNALDIAHKDALGSDDKGPEWLLSPLSDAVDYICDWARKTGAWDAEEIEAWSPHEALALLVQNVASDMRELGCDGMELYEAVENYTDASEDAYSLHGHYWVDGAGIVQGEVQS